MAKSMASYRPGQKRSRLFARVNPNFTSGRYTPPSKNLAQQPSMFRTADPYAGGQSRVMDAVSARRISGGPMGPVAGPGQPQTQPVRGL